MSRYKYEMLLAAQILLSVVSPLFSSTAYARSVIDLGITVVFITAIYVISNTRKHFLIGMVLKIPTLILTWGHQVLSYTDTGIYLADRYRIFLVLYSRADTC